MQPRRDVETASVLVVVASREAYDIGTLVAHELRELQLDVTVARMRFTATVRPVPAWRAR